MAISDYPDSPTCQNTGACIIPQDDPTQAHSQIWFNLTKEKCEIASLGVCCYFSKAD
jgi:hypothetical protein